MPRSEMDAIDIKRIGIIGAGQMGSGIAHLCALSGFATRLVDIGAEQLAKALASIERNMDRQVARGKITDGEKSAALKRIATGTAFDLLRDCDLVIEAATESEELKVQIFKQLRPLLAAHALIATNTTSSLSITRLAASTDRPDRFIGMHFMNPAPVMQLVEVIRGKTTAEATFRTIWDVAARLRKTPVSVDDCPGFIVSRVLLPMINEAVYAVHKGVGSVEDIDTAMRLGANHPMGPLELADFIGLDTCLAIMHVLYDEMANTKYRPCPLLAKLVEAGWLGRKTGKGFYDYAGDRPVPTIRKHGAA